MRVSCYQEGRSSAPFASLLHLDRSQRRVPVLGYGRKKAPVSGAQYSDCNLSRGLCDSQELALRGPVDGQGNSRERLGAER